MPVGYKRIMREVGWGTALIGAVLIIFIEVSILAYFVGTMLAN